jgi:hypothetical protein
MHGGQSLRGIAHPGYKNGRFAKDLLVSLQEDYGQTLRDPKLLELKEEISLLSARVHQRLRQGESGRRWKDIRAGLDALDEALDEGDSTKLKAAQMNLRDTVNSGIRDWANWAEVADLVERIRRLKDSEHKHRIDTRMAITIEQLAAETAAFLDVIQKTVKDPETLRALSNGLRDVIAQRGPTPGAELN